jgi:hypothetical protein
MEFGPAHPLLDELGGPEANCSCSSPPDVPRLPNFFLVGAPKAGTTSLYYYLDQHPQIYMCPIKEPNFFAAEIREENFEPHLRQRLTRQSRSLREFLSGQMREKLFSGIVSEWEDYVHQTLRHVEIARPAPGMEVVSVLPEAVRVNDCVEEAIEQWLEVTEDDPRAGAPRTGAPTTVLEATASV